MLKVNDFYKTSASERWFNLPSRKRDSLHAQLEARGFTLIDRPTLKSEYKDLCAPVGLVDLSYASSIPKPLLGYRSAFSVGHAYEAKEKQFKDHTLSDVISKCFTSTLGEEKFLMSLSPETYLFAKTSSIDFEDICTTIREWGVDCVIGVFDKAGKAMFVFSEEFAVTHISLDPDNVAIEFAEISNSFDSIDFVKATMGRGGSKERMEEYFEAVVKPFV